MTKPNKKSKKTRSNKQKTIKDKKSNSKKITPLLIHGEYWDIG